MAYRAAWPGSSRTVRAAVAAVVGGTDPYPWYPDLDLNTIPWHAASGPWGAAVPVVAPTAPTISAGDTNWTTAAADVSVVSETGKRFIVGANLGNITVNDSVDCEIVIPSGYECGVLYIQGNTQRLRVRGSTIGSHSGGQVARVDLYEDTGDTMTDIIFDGFKISSSTSAFEHSIVITGRPNKFAIVNCKIRACRALFIGAALQIVWAGNSLQSGVITSGQAVGATGPDEAQWTIRHDTEGPVVLYKNDIRGRKYHRFRTGANTTAEAASTLHFINQNQIVDEQEGSITLVLGAETSPASIVTDNDIHAYHGTGVVDGPRFDLEKAMYARITGNRIYSNSIDASFLAGREAAHEAAIPTADVDYQTGNTYAGWSRPSSWIGAGDPSDVTLPSYSIINSTWHDADLVGLAP